MKIEIDLNDVLGDDYGSETLQQSIKRQIVDHLINISKTAIKERINTEVATAVDEEIKAAIKEQMPGIINDLMSQEYYVVNRYGDRSSEPTTFRKQLLKKLNEEMEYAPKNWASEENTFTRTVKDVISTSMTEFQEKFKKVIDDEFFKEAVSYATDKLKKKLG